MDIVSTARSEKLQPHLPTKNAPQGLPSEAIQSKLGNPGQLGFDLRDALNEVLKDLSYEQRAEPDC
jgi:hypothetical protein